jgi:hypothetical protein
MYIGREVLSLRGMIALVPKILCTNYQDDELLHRTRHAIVGRVQEPMRSRLHCASRLLQTVACYQSTAHCQTND